MSIRPRERLTRSRPQKNHAAREGAAGEPVERDPRCGPSLLCDAFTLLASHLLSLSLWPPFPYLGCADQHTSLCGSLVGDWDIGGVFRFSEEEKHEKKPTYRRGEWGREVSGGDAF